MRDDYTKLYDKINDENFDYTSLTNAEYAKLLVGSLIVLNNLEDRIKNEQTAAQNYKINIIPKLQRMVDETKDIDTAILAAELFTIKEESNKENKTNN